MKKVLNSKISGSHHRHTAKPKDLIWRFFATTKIATRSDKTNPESSHRSSWRSYLCIAVLFLLLLLNGSAGRAATAVTSVESASPSSNALVSKEGRAPAKKGAPVPTMVKAGAVKKKGFQLPDADPVFNDKNLHTKEVKGVVMGSAKYGIAVEYASDPKAGGKEIWFNYTKGVSFKGVKAPLEINEGDTVSVTYKEAADKRRLVEEVTLVQRKPKESAELIESGNP